MGNLSRASTASAILALLLAATLSGCMSSGGNLEGTVRLTDHCPSEYKAHCSSENGVLRFHDAHIKGTSGERTAMVGLHILASGPVEVEDVRIEGPDIGVFVDTLDCNGCTVSLSNITIHADRVAIYIQGDEGRVVLDNVNLLTNGGGQIFYETGENVNITHVVDAAYGVQFSYGSRVGLTVRNSTIDATSTSEGGGISGLDLRLEYLRIDGLSIAGYRSGIRYLADETEIRDLEIKCIHGGIKSVLTTSSRGQWFFADGVRIKGCTQDTNLAVGAENAELYNIELQGGIIGVAGADNLTMENFSIEGMDYGVASGPGSGTFQHGVVVNNSYAGMKLTFRNLYVENVSFIGNGHGWPDPDIEPESFRENQRRYGGLHVDPLVYYPHEPTYVTVVGSSFVANVPYGMTASTSPPYNPIATDNWWGSSDGPQVYSEGQEGIFGIDLPPLAVGGNGDNVTSNILFTPWLTAPP